MFCKTPKSLQEIMVKIGLRKRDHGAAHIKALIQAGLLSPTIPDKPRSRRQKYVTTAVGIESID
jgi:ATP-dependent DNA helicase RecG